MGLLDKVMSGDGDEHDSEVAHVILEKIGGRASIISPTRVVFASITAFLIVSASNAQHSLDRGCDAGFLLHFTDHG